MHGAAAAKLLRGCPAVVGLPGFGLARYWLGLSGLAGGAAYACSKLTPLPGLDATDPGANGGR